MPLISRPLAFDPREMVITFDHMLGEGDFVGVMRDALALLAEAYGRPVDTEFAGEVLTEYPAVKTRLTLLQCRPLSQTHPAQVPRIPDVPQEDILFSSSGQAPSGVVEHIQTVVYVDPRAYKAITDPELRVGVGRLIGRINELLPHKSFILIGPGRWGTSNINVGVKVAYADIYNTSVLVEIADPGAEGGPEVSYGTHFFQDLVEANIFPLPLYPDDPGTFFREDFFNDAPNRLVELLPAEISYADIVKVIDLPTAARGTLTVVMNGEDDRAVGYVVRGS